MNINDDLMLEMADIGIAIKDGNEHTKKQLVVYKYQTIQLKLINKKLWIYSSLKDSKKDPRVK